MSTSAVVDTGNERGNRGAWVRAGSIGLTGGVVGGLIGGGSGVLFVPALDRFTTMTRARVHGSSTIANIGVCVAGAVTYAVGGGAIDLRVGTGLMIGGMVGGFLGARLLARASETALRVALIAILLLTAAKFTLDALGVGLVTRSVLPASLLDELWFVVPASVVVGVVIGAWAGAMGLGGGLLAVPVLVLLFGVELHTAAGTSLLIFIPNSIVGSWVHLRQGTASSFWGWLVGLTAAPGVVVGALIGLALDAVALGVVFAVFAFAMAVRETVQLVRRRTASGESSSRTNPLDESSSRSTGGERAARGERAEG